MYQWLYNHTNVQLHLLNDDYSPIAKCLLHVTHINIYINAVVTLSYPFYEENEFMFIIQYLQRILLILLSVFFGGYAYDIYVIGTTAYFFSVRTRICDKYNPEFQILVDSLQIIHIYMFGQIAIIKCIQFQMHYTQQNLWLKGGNLILVSMMI